MLARSAARPAGRFARVLSGIWVEVAALAAAFAIAVVTTPAGVSGAVLLLPFQVSVLGTPSPSVTPDQPALQRGGQPRGRSGVTAGRGRPLAGRAAGVPATTWLAPGTAGGQDDHNRVVHRSDSPGAPQNPGVQWPGRPTRRGGLPARCGPSSGCWLRLITSPVAAGMPVPTPCRGGWPPVAACAGVGAGAGSPPRPSPPPPARRPRARGSSRGRSRASGHRAAARPRRCMARRAQDGP
jgi:hypothetical protein